MTTVHLHLLLNHLPIIGTIIGTLILLGGFILKNSIIKRTALAVFIFAAIMAVPAFLTGDGAEDAIKNMTGISEGVIDRHEELSKIFLGILIGLGILSIAALFTDLRNRKFTRGLYIIVFVLAIAGCIFATQAGMSGGEIRHTEIRATGSAVQSATHAQQPAKDEESKD